MKWIYRRIIVLFLTIWVAITINFFLVRLMPGNPIDILIMQYMEMGYSYKEAVTAVAAIVPFIPNEPIWKQYIDFILGVFRGDLGRSITLAVPIGQLLAYAIPWTVFIVSISLIISFSIGIVLGMYIAYRRGSLLDKALSLLASVLGGFPHYAAGVLLALFLGVELNLFPIIGPYDPEVEVGFNLPFILSVLRHAALPVLTYFVTSFGGWMLSMKSSTASVLGEYFVAAAEARGLPRRRIVLTYVGRNAILPLFTRLAISIGYMFGGVVFIENIFSYPGIGQYLTMSLTNRDYPLMTGCFLVTTMAVVLSNFVAELLYSRLDPRIRTGG